MEHLNINQINEMINFWTEQEWEAQRLLDRCHANVEKYLGMKTLKLIAMDGHIVRGEE